MKKYKNDVFGKFTFELSRINYDMADIKNLQLILENSAVINFSYKRKLELISRIEFLQDKVDYINNILNQMYWKDKAVLIRYFVRGYSYKKTGCVFHMSERYISNRICVYMRKKYTSLIDVKRLR